MNTQQIDWLKSLPNADTDGTLNSLLLRSDIATIPFEKALSFLVQALMNDKTTLSNENKKMSYILKEHNLYHKILEN